MVSTDATLSGGTVTAGSTTLVTFASDTTAYTASVANGVEEVTFAPTKHAEATVRYLKGTDVLTDADGTDDGFQVALAVGANAITVEVTAEDGTTTQDYTVTVTRAAGASTPVWSTTLTVGKSGNRYGYKDGQGALGDDDFEYGSVTYTVSILGVATGDVQFRVNREGLPTADTLTLELGGHEFPFSARVNPGGTLVWYWNPPDDLDDPETEFPVGTTATACLRTATQTCPAGRIDLPAALPTLSIDDVSATEGDPLTFTVTLSAASDETVTVVYATADDTGISPSDYTDASDTLTFAAGVTTQTITVATTEDTTVESSETITVLLSNATNATISDDTGTGTIEDDDTAMTPTCTLNTGDLWCGVVTVGDVTNTNGDIVRHGFQGTTGGLSDETFSLMFETGTTNEYTITAIAVGATGEQLYFVTSALTDTEEESLALHVDDESDPFVWSDSTELVPGSYRWPARTGLDWSSETTVTLRLREFPRPTVTNVAVTSTPVLETDTYGAGETIEVSVTFSEAVTATSDTDFVLSVAGATRAPLLSGSGTATLVFGYTVAPGDEDDNGIWIGDEDRTLVGNRNGDAQAGAITSTATGAAANIEHAELGTQSGHKVDGTRSIRTVEVTSIPLLETDTYGAGETIEFTVTFNVAVDVTGDPEFAFSLDSGEDRAPYVSGGGGTALVFGYTVASGDEDDNGIFLLDGSDFNNRVGPVALDSDDEIEFKDTTTDVPLAWPSGRGTQSGHKVDGSRTAGNTAPSFTSSAAFDAAENQTAAGTVAATDSDADDSVTGYAIAGGADMALFEIGATSGELTFKSAPNFEDPQDSGTDNIHEVTVRATSGAGTRVMTADQTIAVTVTNADEGQSGTVTIDDTAPTVGDELTASAADAADPDGLPDPFAPTWKWYRTPDGGSETEITGETSATYTVVAADLGATLTAKASWIDTGGFANTLASAPTSAVAAASTLPTLSIADASAAEGADISFPLTLSAAASEAVTVTCTASFGTGDTAVAADLTALVWPTTIQAGSTTGQCGTLFVQDTLDEDDETFTVTLSNVSSNAQLASDPTAKGTIVDDDTAPTVTGVEVTSEPVLETDTYGAGETIEVSVTFDEAVNATSATDFVLSVGGATPAPLVSGSGTATLVFGYTVAPGDEDDDGIWIGDDTRTLVGDRNGNPQAGAIASTATGTAADLDHTGLPVQSGHKVDGSRSIVGVAIPSRPMLESDTYGAGETIRFRVTFTAAVDVTGDPVFRFSLGNSGETREVDAAYEGGTGTDRLVFGYTVVSTDVDNDGIFLLDDADLDAPDGPVRLDSNDEIEFKDTSIDVPLKWPEGRRGLRSNHKVDGSRTTGNVAPNFTSSTAFDAAENQTAVGTVEADDSDSDDSVTGYALAGGADQALFEIDGTTGVLTFKSAPDFEDPQDTGTDNVHEVTVRATSGAGTRVMTADQTIAVTVTNVTEGQSGTVTIDDTTPMVGDELTASTANAADPDGLPDPFAPTWKWYRTPDGGSETEISGETSATYTVVAADLGATLAAKATWTDTGGFANTLASAATSAVAAASALPTLSIGTGGAPESTIIGFAVILSATASADVTATCTASFESGDTASAADLSTTTGTATINAGSTSALCRITPVQDTIDEEDETFTVTLSNPSPNAQLGAPVTAQGTIEDDDDPPTVSVGDVSAEEGTALTFTVALSAASGKTVTVDWAASAESGDTATAGTDFTAVAATTLTFDAGQEEKTIEVQTTEDSADENDETFTVTLSSPSNATIPDATAKGTIEDDDGTALPTLSVGNASATEGSLIRFPLTLSATPGEIVSVTCTASFETGDTAAAADLSTTTSTATIQIGATSGSCAISSAQDTIDEDNETFTVTLSSPSSNAQLATDPTAKGTIVDDDTAPTITDVSVTSTPVLATGTYGAGETIEVSVTFDEAVNATSATDFELNVSDDKSAPLLRGSGTATLVFGYTVAPGDEDDNGIWIGDQDRTLVGDRRLTTQAGAITSTATGTAADLTHAELGRQDNHKVDGTRSIVSVAVTSTPQLETDTYGAGETIEFTVTFNVAVDVTGDPVLEFLLDGSEVRQASDVSGSGTTTLVFSYTVVSGDDDDNGLFIRDESDYNSPDGPVRLDSNDEIEFKDTSTDVPLYWAGRGTQSGHKVDGSRTTDNVAPVFADDLVAITLPENSAVGTSVGAAVTATDADSDTLTYSLEGTDAASFDIDSGTGQIETKSGVTYDFEATQNTYEMTVKADDGNGGTDTIEVNIALLDADEKSAKPAKPELEAVSGSSTSLTATWETPDKNGGPAITGYKLEYKESTETSWTAFAHTGTAVTTTITGLTADTSYQARVRAENGETDSDWSDASDAESTNAETADPTCTLDTAAGDIWCGVLTVGAVSSNQDGFFGSTGGLTDTTFSVGSSNYMIEQLTVESPTATNAGDLLLGLGRDRVLSAANRDRLVLHVDDSGDMFAFNATAASGFSLLWTGTDLDWSSATTVTLRLRLTPEVPGKPTNLMAEADGSTRIALSWDAPADDGGSAITGYRIEVSDDGGSNWSELEADTGDDGTSYTHEGLSPGDTRHYRVSAINAEGTSDASDSDSATTVAAGTCALNPGDLWCGVVTVADLGSGADGFGSTGGLSDTTFSVGGRNYTIRQVSVGNSTSASPGTLLFSLHSVLDAADQARLELHVDGSGDTFAFSAIAGVGSSFIWPGTSLDWSSATTVTLRLRLAPEAPGKPTNLVAEADGGTRIALSWEAPADDGGSAITGYRIEVSPDGSSGSWTELEADTGNDGTSYTHTGLSPGDTRHYRVSAINAEGRSVASDVAHATTMREIPAADASLSMLTVTRSGGVTVPLLPRFAPETTAYSVSVVNAVDEVTVAATANVAGATLDYLDGDGAAIADADTNTPGREVALEVGATVVEVKVTAEDGTTMRAYRVRVTRRAADAPGEEGELRLTEPEPYADTVIGRYDGTAGRVEVSHAGRWGTVCSDGIRDSTFDTFHHDANNALVMTTDAEGNDVPSVITNDNEAAALICKAMDYDDGEYQEKYSKFRRGAAVADHQDADYWPPDSSYPADGPKPIWIDDLRCVPGQPALELERGRLPWGSHCNYAGWGLHNCTHKEDAVVRCWNNGDLEPPENERGILKGRFVSPPERHDGENRIKVRVGFSEAPENVGAHGVEVEGGAVTSVSPVGGDASGGAGTRSVGGGNAGRQDREVVWEFEIEPDSVGDVTVSIEAGRPCDEEGAICTADGRSLSEDISTTVEGPDEGPPPLTASFVDLPEAHDGESAFRFRLAFSERIAISFRSLREDAFEVAGGRVTRGKRVDGRKDLFEITVEPDGAGEVAISLPAGRDCEVSGAICTWGPPRKPLTNTPTATVAGPAVETGPAPLTASFVDMPDEHDGESAFTFRIAFSERVGWMNGRRLRENVVAVTGGRATSASRVNRRRDLWQVTVEPDSLADVTVTLEAGAACGTPAAVCTSDGRALSNTISTTVRGPVTVSVADARAEEGTDETIDFAVSLSRAGSDTITVDYATADGTATAGSDYMRASGKLRFAPGETGKTVRVPVLDDVVDEGEETFTLRLLNASGARIADGEATGTIENSDPLQKMWLSRFGRTVAGQVVDAVTGRLWGPPGGSQVTLGGRSIDLSAPSADTVDARRTLAGALGAQRGAEDDDPLAGPGAWEAARAGSWTDPESGGTVRGMTGRELLLGSSFHLAAGSGEVGGPGYAAWGRVAVGGFDAEAPADNGTLRLDGEVTTGILGADAHWERWLAGVALSVSEGEGTFDQPGVDSGTVESTLTSVNPYVRYEANDRLTAWSLLGYGTGDMTIRGKSPVRTDLMMRLGAAGARGVLLEADEDGGIDLALRGDAFLVQMESEAAANSVETKADASRLRLVLEAGRSFALGEGAVLAPTLELGLRHDGGDAETGTGVEVGGRIRFADAGSGLTVEANARTLIAHEDSGYREWGAGGSVRLDPGASGRGLSLSLAPVWGTPSSGVDRLWSARDAAGLVRDDEFEAERRLEGEVGYGFGAFGSHGVVTPYAGLGLAEAGDRTWRAGARWSLAPHLAMSLDGTRREAANDDAPEHGVQFRFTLRW